MGYSAYHGDNTMCQAVGIDTSQPTRALTFCDVTGTEVFGVDLDGTTYGDVDAAIAIPNVQKLFAHIIPLLRAIKRLQERTV